MEKKGAGKPITLLAYLPLLLLLVAVHRRGGGDVSIWMVWLCALEAITAMRGAAVYSTHQMIQAEISSLFD